MLSFIISIRYFQALCDNISYLEEGKVAEFTDSSVCVVDFVLQRFFTHYLVSNDHKFMLFKFQPLWSFLVFRG